MAIRTICQYGEAVLKKKSKVVEKIDHKVLQLLDDMVDTLDEADGIGLAAPQVGILKRIVIIDTGDEILELINPVIKESEGEQHYLEGCLSYPGQFGNVGRPEKVTVVALNREGEEVVYKEEGLLAVAFCHEIDHLEGDLFFEKVKGKLFSTEEIAELREKDAGES